MLSLIQSSSLIYASALYAVLWSIQGVRKNNRLQAAWACYQVRRVDHLTRQRSVRWP